MRIGHAAELADTTTRAVRHYHRLGLLDEPPRRSNGYRDYTMADVVRLMRIRWLAGSGVPLDAIAGMLDQDTAQPVEADLEALIDDLDERRALLTRRRARLAAMLDDARRGRPLSPLPGRLADLFRDVLDSDSLTGSDTLTPAQRSALQRERDMVEALAMSGQAPAGLIDGVTALLEDPGRRSRYLRLLGRWAALEHRDPESVRDEVAEVADALAALMEGWYPEGPDDGTETPDDDPQAPPLLDDVVADAAQRDVVARLLRRIRTSAPPAGGPP